MTNEFLDSCKKAGMLFGKRNKKDHKHIDYFNPDVMPLEQSHQDFSENQSFWKFAKLIEGQSWGAAPFVMPVYEGHENPVIYRNIVVNTNFFI